MSNIFKTNSRFAALADDIPAKKDKKEHKKPFNETKNEEKEEKFNSFKSDNNSFKDNGFRERRYNRYYSERYREAEEKARKEEEEIRKQEEEIRKQKALTSDNFPELCLNKKEKTPILQELNYLEQLKKVDVKDEDKDKDIDPDLKNLKPGWLLIKKDKLTNKIIMKEKVSNIKTPEILEENEQEIAINIINALAELYERRTREYIELNGYDTWEKMFKFPDWREREAELEDESDEDYEDETEDTEEEYM
jgi:hypothetical protein